MNSNQSFKISESNILKDSRRAAKNVPATIKKGGSTSPFPNTTTTLSGQRRNSYSRLAPSPPSGRSGGLPRTPPRLITSGTSIVHSPRPNGRTYTPKLDTIPSIPRTPMPDSPQNKLPSSPIPKSPSSPSIPVPFLYSMEDVTDVTANYLDDLIGPGLTNFGVVGSYNCHDPGGCGFETRRCQVPR
eukprot:GHVP01027906.1.p1 GENE.GHVP01027906.1~~GHVP01027906.1.p1  ORF type:complete len:186 (+),score=6.88 GHVP01027906.1:155-712(+)